MQLAVDFISYGLVALFGIALSAEFVGVQRHSNAEVKLVIFATAALMVQLCCWLAFGEQATFCLYPLIMHVPLAVFLALAFRCPPVQAAVAVLCAYLCCQVPRWLADATYLFVDSGLVRDVVHVFALIAVYAALHRWAVGPTRKLLSHSRQSALILGALPFLYYLFDYASAVYSDALYTGNALAAQFVPTVMACAYFFFLLAYHAKTEESEKARREQELLALQLKGAQSELESIQSLQDQARRYRHDLRHHLGLLLGFAEAGDMRRVEAYIHGLEQDLSASAMKHYCSNSVVDLLLSHFAEKAEAAGVAFSAQANVPAKLPLEDVDMCSLLANALENAIDAAAGVEDAAARSVAVHLSVKQQNLLVSVENAVEGAVEFKDGIPVTTRAGHGVGTRSIVSVVKRHGGHVSFFAENGAFTLWAMLPLGD